MIVCHFSTRYKQDTEKFLWIVLTSIDKISMLVYSLYDMTIPYCEKSLIQSGGGTKDL